MEEEYLNNSITFNDLNKDVLSIIMFNMCYNDVISLCLTNRYTGSIYEDIQFWRLYLKRKYHISFNSSLRDLRVISEFYSIIDRMNNKYISLYSGLFHEFKIFLTNSDIISIILFMRKIHPYGDEVVTPYEKLTNTYLLNISVIMEQFTQYLNKDIYQIAAYDESQNRYNIQIN